jgi:hypothetical protein
MSGTGQANHDLGAWNTLDHIIKWKAKAHVRPEFVKSSRKYRCKGRKLEKQKVFGCGNSDVDVPVERLPAYKGRDSACKAVISSTPFSSLQMLSYW